MRSKIEYVFLIVKKQFGYAKVAYRGIEKNMNRFLCCLPASTCYYAPEPSEQWTFAGVSVPIFRKNREIRQKEEETRC